MKRILIGLLLISHFVSCYFFVKATGGEIVIFSLMSLISLSMILFINQKGEI